MLDKNVFPYVKITTFGTKYAKIPASVLPPPPKKNTPFMQFRKLCSKNKVQKGGSGNRKPVLLYKSEKYESRRGVTEFFFSIYNTGQRV